MEVEIHGKTYRLNLETVDDKKIEQAISTFVGGDVRGFLSSTKGKASSLALVADNASALKERGIYEQALFEAWIDTKVSSGGWDFAALQKLLNTADGQRLRSLGEPVGNQPITVYRGVSGEDRKQKVKGFCWTESLDIACWYATQLENPAVYTATLQPDEIFFITNERCEREVVGLPKSARLVRTSAKEMQKRARAHEDAAHDKDEQERGDAEHPEDAKRTTGAADSRG